MVERSRALARGGGTGPHRPSAVFPRGVDVSALYRYPVSPIAASGGPAYWLLGSGGSITDEWPGPGDLPQLPDNW